MSLVQVDPWPASNFGLDIDASGRRLARGVAYLLDGPGGNPYARPIENLVALLDRDTGQVIEITDGEAIQFRPTSPTSTQAAPASPPGRRPTARSPTPTSCCGTQSARPTSAARKTSPSCPAST
jgi:hypothetical protein